MRRVNLELASYWQNLNLNLKFMRAYLVKGHLLIYSVIAIKIGLKGLSISLTSFVDMLYLVIIRGVVNFMLVRGQETPKTSKFVQNNPSSPFIAPSCP